jgi:hypothetical protein
MDKTLNFLRRNIFGIVCFFYLIGYLIFKFNTWESAALFLFTLLLLYFSFFFFIDFCRKVIYEGMPVRKALYANRINTLLLTGINIPIILLAGWNFLSAFWLGISVFAVVVTLLFYFKKKIVKQ